MRFLSWNVASRRRGLTDQIERVVGCEPDVVGLQEISAGIYPAWREGLMEAGYSVIGNVDLVALPYPPPPYPAGTGRGGQISRTKFNVTASRHPIASLDGLAFPDPDEANLAFPEKYLVAEVLYDETLVEVHNAHSPPGSTRGIVKPQAFRAMRRRLDRRTNVPQVLCGDFNTPMSEDDDKLVTAASRHPEHEREWDEAERGILENGRLDDAYRKVRKPGTEFAVSHRTQGRECRYDHIYASAHFEVEACFYKTNWLDQDLSDHAGVVADLCLAPTVPT